MFGVIVGSTVMLFLQKHFGSGRLTARFHNETGFFVSFIDRSLGDQPGGTAVR